ncbi:hypothetical protein EV128_117127 [Rhizobium azibense]|nr:hypothetical protein EV128_117127 [Rhizobium azibense]
MSSGCGETLSLLLRSQRGAHCTLEPILSRHAAARECLLSLVGQIDPDLPTILRIPMPYECRRRGGSRIPFGYLSHRQSGAKFAPNLTFGNGGAQRRRNERM